MKGAYISLVCWLSLCSLALAQETLYTRPQKSAQGEWLSNGGPVTGAIHDQGQMAGALWRVISRRGLNCRRGPELNSAIVRRLAYGTQIQADLGRGGSDDVYYNALDSRKQAWMLIRTAQGQKLNCYLRAHQSLIQPLSQR